MDAGLVIGAGSLATVTAAGALTGWWRYLFAPFGIRPKQMTVERLGLLVRSEESIARVNTILASFAGGFNRMIARPSADAWRAYTDSLPTLYRAFSHEGAAMGYQLRYLLGATPRDFEDRLVRVRPDFRYLYYVGLGFWAGMKRQSPRLLTRTVAQLDPLHGYLCYDGYGFKHAFFDYPKRRAIAARNVQTGSLAIGDCRLSIGDCGLSIGGTSTTDEASGEGACGLRDVAAFARSNAFRRINALDGYARRAAYHGVGRAMYFLFMDEPTVLIAHVEALGEHAIDAAAGLGLAAVFVNPDRLQLAQQLGEKLPPAWQPHFHLGMCFGLKARSINDVDQFERDMAAYAKPMQEAVFASIRECDRVELQVRDSLRALCASKGSPQAGRESNLDHSGVAPSCAYQQWRDRVTQWMSGHIDYPMQGLKTSATGLRPIAAIVPDDGALRCGVTHGANQSGAKAPGSRAMRDRTR